MNNSASEQNQATYYDYTNQAWIVDGVYKSCNHPASACCGCYGKKHAGEKPAA